jgi:glyoxylase-like metal-dependent hydrolase (beta-lactamase superfamily II)
MVELDIPSEQRQAATRTDAPVRLSARIVRVTAPNGGVMTGPGTNTYLVGDPSDNVWTVLDPGPSDAAHIDAIVRAAPGRIGGIVVTHTHIDHSPGARPLKALTGAPVYGMRPAHSAKQDSTFEPDRVLRHGERLPLGSHTTLRVVHTPGHASNHLCYLLEEEQTLFTGDHVMQGSTAIINPPDGDMSAYLRSLDALRALDIEWFAPGHGTMMSQPDDVIARLMRHRMLREAKVTASLRRTGGGTLEQLVVSVYDDVPESRHGIAMRSLDAHLQKLELDGAAVQDAGVWRPASA